MGFSQWIQIALYNSNNIQYMVKNDTIITGYTNWSSNGCIENNTK